MLRLSPVIHLSDEQLIALCAINHEVWIERNAQGELLLMPPAVSDIRRQELDVAGQLWTWAKRDGTGVAFGPSSGFRLPNTAVRAADAAWIRRPRWEAISAEEREKFAPLCPDFVIELRSPSSRRSRPTRSCPASSSTCAGSGDGTDGRSDSEAVRPGFERTVESRSPGSRAGRRTGGSR